MDVHATAKVKIPAFSEIVSTLKVYSRGLQYCVDTAWQKGIRNNIRLHPFVYEHLRGLGLQSQLAIACIKQACGMVKKAKTKPIIKKMSMRYNFNRSASLKGNVLSISTMKGRVKIPFTIPACYEEYFSWDVSESLLRIDKKGRCFFLFSFTKTLDDIQRSNENVLGIDLGINNLAVTSDGRFFNSSKIKQTKRKFKHLRSKLQKKGTRSAKKFLRKLSGRENCYMTWINHNVSKKIVSDFDGGAIVMENLKGIRRRSRGRTMNYWISNWSFNQLQTFITYKAERKGIRVEKVKPEYTSQLCHKCGRLGTRLKGSFSCTYCSLSSYSADLNAAKNLAHPMLDERQAAVNQPNVSNAETETLQSGLRWSLETNTSKGVMPHSLL